MCSTGVRPQLMINAHDKIASFLIMSPRREWLAFGVLQRRAVRLSPMPTGLFIALKIAILPLRRLRMASTGGHSVTGWAGGPWLQDAAAAGSRSRGRPSGSAGRPRRVSGFRGCVRPVHRVAALPEPHSGAAYQI